MGKQTNKPNPKRQRKRFSREFKLEAVRLLALGQKPASQLALELGIQRNRLYKWAEERKQSGPDAAFRGSGRKPPDQQGEIERLKRELKKVAEERDILKKAAADSTSRCNTTCSNRNLGGLWYGTTWTTRHDRCPEERVVASLARRRVPERYRARRGQVSDLDLRGLRLHGGFTPPARKRAVITLTLSEREEISRGLSAGSSLRQIARELHRSPSTIRREIARNGDSRSYRANQADEKAWDPARRPKPCRLALNSRLRCIVATKLAQDWSPEQIAGWLKRTYPEDESLRVSHETIYRSLFVQTRGVPKKAPVAVSQHPGAGARSHH
jgi:transposase-like protein/DNA-binding CsgD family transcriptional regulator